MKLFVLFFGVFLLSFYLYFSYTGFYSFISNANLKSPYLENSLLLKNSNGVGNIKYIALGDSLSAGVGSTGVTDTFVYQYALNLSKKYADVQLINLAQSGATTQDVIKYQVARTIEEQPDYVTLLIGTNDINNKVSARDFKNNYQYILNELISKTNAKITVLNIPYLASNKLLYFPFNLIYDFRIKQFNTAILDLIVNLAEDNRVQLVDLYTNTYLLQKQDSNYYSPDLFHPSGNAYHIWSEIIDAN